MRSIEQGIACWLVLASIIVGAVACREQQTALLLEVRSAYPIDNLTVYTKKYHSQGLVETFPGVEAVIGPLSMGYVGPMASTPLRLNIDVPGSARYAFHLVGRRRDGQGVVIATVCRRVFETAFVGYLNLAPLPAELDVDGDSFPEDAAAFCAMATDFGPCEQSCLAAAYQAMEDCNPLRDAEVAPESSQCDELPDDAQWNPFATDGCGDCHDTDCFDGDAPCPDLDGDGYGVDDCNNEDPNIHPGATEICGNGIDENCAIDTIGCDDGDQPCDSDGDGYRHQVSPRCGQDCNDQDPAIHPGAAEGVGSNPADPEAAVGCNDLVDNNCDGKINEGCFADDLDNDGVPFPDDCNDCNPGVGPGLREICGNSLDDDCLDGDLACSPHDWDRDGVAAPSQGEDCNDQDPLVFPGAPDYCLDDIAQNCNFALDCSDDHDGDGFRADDGDCHDGNSAIHPWAEERCDPDGVDEDCDGLVNEVDSGRGCIYDIHLSHWSQIDFASNLDHCGQCRNRCCPSPSECEGDRCNNGTCRCNGGPACQGRPTNACCGPSGCIDLTTNLEHCGQCGKRCAPGEYCRADHERVAVCVCPHEPDQGACDNSPGGSCCPGAGCVNINTDVDHCGRCGNDCAAGPRPQGDSCSNGNCRCGPNREQCAPGQWCTGVLNPEEGSCGCANLMEDEEHCGNCWTQCDTNETCQSGTCRCGSGGSNCRGQPNNFCCGGSSCVNLVSDENNCGTCGNRCRPGEQCQNGQCRCANGCNDGNRCTEDFCYPGSNRCGHSPKDSDNDGYCDETCCPGGRCPSGCRHTKGDCNDSAANVNPGADEACFILGSDRDCDGNRAPFDSDCSPF